MKNLKSAARLFDRNGINKKGLDLSKEVLWVFIGRRAAELLAVKVGGQKKKNSATKPGAGEVGSNRAARQNFLLTSNFDSP